MADIDVNQILVQMRAMAASAQGGVAAQQPAAATGADFASLLQSSVNQVNSAQKTAGSMSEAFAKGDPSVDLTEVMVAVQKSSISFQAMLQVRNKLVQAYQDVMNTPL